MADARLEVTDAFGQRTVTLDKPTFTIGRRDSNDLRLAGSEVSRDHADITFVDGRVLFRDRGSRYGSFVNGEQVTESPLTHGDKIRLGLGLGAEIVFLVFLYGVWRLPVAMLAGAGAGLACGINDRILWYPGADLPFTAVYITSTTISGAVIAGLGGWLLMKALASTGALSRFASGREATARV